MVDAFLHPWEAGSLVLWAGPSYLLACSPASPWEARGLLGSQRCWHLRAWANASLSAGVSSWHVLYQGAFNSRNCGGSQTWLPGWAARPQHRVVGVKLLRNLPAKHTFFGKQVYMRKKWGKNVSFAVSLQGAQGKPAGARAVVSGQPGHWGLRFCFCRRAGVELGFTPCATFPFC